MILETFGTLLRDPAHWYFELFLIFIFDIVVGAIVWPFIKAHIHRDTETEHDHIGELEDIVGALLMRVRKLEGHDDPAITEAVSED